MWLHEARHNKINPLANPWDLPMWLSLERVSKKFPRRSQCVVGRMGGRELQLQNVGNAIGKFLLCLVNEKGNELKAGPTQRQGMINLGQYMKKYIRLEHHNLLKQKKNKFAVLTDKE